MSLEVAYAPVFSYNRYTSLLGMGGFRNREPAQPKRLLKLEMQRREFEVVGHFVIPALMHMLRVLKANSEVHVPSALHCLGCFVSQLWATA